MALQAKSFALAGGVLWGLVCFIMALVSGTGYGLGLVHGLGTLYLGYTPGIVGAVIGLIYGFLDAFIGLFIFAWLYNHFESKVG